MTKRYFKEENSSHSWVWVWNEDGTYKSIYASTGDIDGSCYDDGMTPEQYKEDVELDGGGTFTELTYEEAVLEAI